MKSEEAEAEANIFSIDWASLSEEDRLSIISEHIHYVSISRKAINAKGFHSANFRALFLMLLLGLSMSLLQVDNGTIILVMIGFQFLRTLISQLFEASLSSAVDISKKELAAFVLRRTQKR
jgi:hypothetical protein